MSEINFPNRDELNQNTKVDIRSELQGSNPFLRNSWLGSIAAAISLRIFDFYEKLKELLTQFFFDTAENPYMNQWSSIFGIITKPASQGSGNIVAEGLAGSSIVNNSKLSVSGIQYTTLLSASIQDQTLGITSLSRVGGIVTVITASPHNLATGVSVVIAGAVEVEYNGTQIIIVTGSSSFTYLIETAPTTPATGTITASFNTALIPVQADTDFFGVDTNQDPGTQISFTQPISGVNNAAFVDFDGITGGADQESTEDQRIRFLFRVQNPVANFNESAITLKALEIEGNTRVFVEEITPGIGQVTIYFTRDNSGIIPTTADVAKTKEKILEIKPANTDESDVFVLPPTPKVVDFSFNSLVPNTGTMQGAINANLDAFFESKTKVGVDLTENEYKAAIQNTIDTETGDFLSSFTLLTPSGNVSVASGEIPVKGNVSFP